MNYDSFLNKWNGKQVIAYGGECVALVAQYCAENGKPIAWANAKDWWGNGSLTGAFDFIKNNPADLKQVPKRGDIMIWDGGLAGSGGYGHIAIFDRIASPGVFVSFDQNWGGRQAHQVSHNWNNIIGWMTPKVAAPPVTAGDNNMFQNAQEVIEAYQGMFGRTPSAAEIAGWVGQSKQRFFQVGKAEADNQRTRLAQAEVQLANMQKSINDLNKTVTDINSQTNATKAQLQEAITKVSGLTSELETAHDKITELQKQPVVDEKQVVTNVLVRFWNSLFKKM